MQLLERCGMPERWRLEPGTLTERWLAAGWGVQWTDGSRCYWIFDPAHPELAKAHFRTLDEVETWVAARQPTARWMVLARSITSKAHLTRPHREIPGMERWICGVIVCGSAMAADDGRGRCITCLTIEEEARSMLKEGR